MSIRVLKMFEQEKHKHKTSLFQPISIKADFTDKFLPYFANYAPFADRFWNEGNN